MNTPTAHTTAANNTQLNQRARRRYESRPLGRRGMRADFKGIMFARESGKRVSGKNPFWVTKFQRYSILFLRVFQVGTVVSLLL